MKVYKIRNKNTGLYTEGGRYANNSWNENGKIWFSLKNLLNFFKFYIKDQINYYKYTIESENIFLKKNKKPLKEFIYLNKEEYLPEDWEIVEFEMTELNCFSARSKFFSTES